MAQAQRYIVKSVISGDSLVLRQKPGQPPVERVLHLADITAPRLGSSTRDDEPWSFEAREFLRSLIVGKEVAITSIHSLPPNEGTQRDLGHAYLPGNVDITHELLRNGWAQMKDLKHEPTEEDNKRKELEAEAKTAGKGLWNPHGPQARNVNYNMPADPQAFLLEWKGKNIDAIVEQVREGSNLRVRLLLPEGDHQLVNIALAGVRCPRVSSKKGEPSEPFGEDAKTFTETRLLQRPVRVQLLSLPMPTATPFQSTANGSAPPPPSSIIGSVIHPAGNIAEHLVATGLARVVDWHAGMLAAGGAMERLRAAERTAKEKRACLYANVPTPASHNGSNGATAAANGPSRTFDAIVIRVWSGDQISVAPKEGGKERRIQLSSTRAPRGNDPKQAYWAAEAKEFLRKKLIGKHVKVQVDFIRPKEGEFEERECATVRYGGHNANIAEQLIEKGLATALRHRRDDEDRSPDYDKLMVAEQTAATETRGLHGTKEYPPPKPPVNISESASRANSFVNGFKRLGRIPAVVDYVAAGSRFRILIPKDNQVLTLVLAGVRAPRSARPGEKGEPYGAESAEFATRRYMQRDVEIEFDSVDKSGGFIGALYLNKTENAAVTLVKEGLAGVHSYSADTLPWAKVLYDAEAEAKKAQVNMWKEYDEAEEQQAAVNDSQNAGEVLSTSYMDVIVSDVRPTQNGLNFSVQVLNTEGIASLEKLMHEFSLHHRGAVGPANFAPKAGELVSAKFSDGAWYRARVRRSSALKKEAEVTFIDYGNQDTIAFKDIRPLDPKFRSLPGQAQDARLSCVKLVDADSEYYQDAVARFRSLCEGRKLIANVDHKEGSLLHLRLMDPADPETSANPPASINGDLLREGLASIDKKGCRYLSGYPSVLKKLQDAVRLAKVERLGMFEFGDVEEDD